MVIAIMADEHVIHMPNFSISLNQNYYKIHRPTAISWGGGRTRLPKFKFSTKFSIGLHVILELLDKKNQNLLESDPDYPDKTII